MATWYGWHRGSTFAPTRKCADFRVVQLSQVHFLDSPWGSLRETGCLRFSALVSAMR
jgi:hypothetical protein